MARITKMAQVFPMNKGLDLTTVSGANDPKSLKVAKNVHIKHSGALDKAPGVRSLDYIGGRSGIQAAIQFFGTSDGGPTNEIVQVINGRVEVVRNNEAVDLGISVSPTDTITFERFGQRLIIHFENTRPKIYAPGGSTLSNWDILSTHVDAPPRFSRNYAGSIWYGGRGNFPHRVLKSAVDNLTGFKLVDGALPLRIREDDGDPVGVTGLSPIFRGDMFVSKWNSIHRVYRGQYTWNIDNVTDELGCVHHNTWAMSQNDLYFVSSFGVHSLVNTDTYGAVREATLTAPIYEWFQENVNWSRTKYMISTFDKMSSNFLLSYSSAGSSVNDRVLSINIITKEITVWEDTEYPVLTKYHEAGRTRTLVGDSTNGLGVLDDKEYTRFGKKIDVEIWTRPLFLLQEKNAELTFTRAFINIRPEWQNLEFTVEYYVDGEKKGSEKFSGKGKQIGAIFGEAIYGKDADVYGYRATEAMFLEMDLQADGSTIEFRIIQEPTEEDPDIPFSFRGILVEYTYNENTDKDVSL